MHFIKVDSWDLREAFSYQMRFVAYIIPIIISFSIMNPFLLESFLPEWKLHYVSSPKLI